jgi:hypothetical protein
MSIQHAYQVIPSANTLSVLVTGMFFHHPIKAISWKKLEKLRKNCNLAHGAGILMLDTNKIQPEGAAPFFTPQKNLFWTGVRNIYNLEQEFSIEISPQSAKAFHRTVLHGSFCWLLAFSFSSPG